MPACGVSGAGRRGRRLSAVVAKVRLVVDFRSDRMESPEGRGKARRAWDSYAGAVEKVTSPVLGPLVRMYAAGSIFDLVAFREGWAQKKQEKAAAAQSQV